MGDEPESWIYPGGIETLISTAAKSSLTAPTAFHHTRNGAVSPERSTSRCIRREPVPQAGIRS